MTRNALAHQIERLGTPIQKKIFLGGCILFVLLTVLLYTLSVVRGELKVSLAFALIVPLFATMTLLAFNTPSHKIRDTHLPWHWQSHVLVGIMYSGVSLISLIIITDLFVGNSLPDIVVEVGSGIGLLLIVFAYMRRGTMRRRQSKLAKEAASTKPKKE